MFYKILLSVLSLILALIIIEILFSVLDIYAPRPIHYVEEYKYENSNIFKFDKNVGWKMVPNNNFQWITEKKRIKYYSNEKGFRVSKNHSSLDKYNRL